MTSSAPTAPASSPTDGGRLSFREKVAYGFGDTASNLYFQMFTNFLLYFYTDVFGITAAAAGTMFAVVRSWDTFVDPVMGVAADRTNTRWGHYRPYLLWGCVPMAVLGVAMFTTPNFTPAGKLVYAYVTYSLIMLGYSFINIPYSALMGVISPSSDERTSVSSYRFTLAYVGLFIVQGATLILVKWIGGGDAQRGFQGTMGVYGVLAVALFLVTFAGTRERVQPAEGNASSLRDDLKDLLGNGPWIVVCFVGVFALGYISLRTGVIIYYFKYYIGDEALASGFMTAGTVGVVAGAALAGPISRLLGGKRRAYMILMTAASALTVVFYFIPRDRIVLIFACHILISTLFAPTSPLLWAFYADTADYSEWKSGRRATGLVFSAASFSQKLGWAVGGSLPGWMLSYYGFQPNVAQGESVLGGIRLIMSIFPAVAGFLSAGAVLVYSLDDDLMARIERELKARKPPAA